MAQYGYDQPCNTNDAPCVGRHQVDKVMVADDKVHADGYAKACGTGQTEGLPQAPRRRRAPGAQAYQQAARADATTKAGAVVRDERNEPWVDGGKVTRH